MSNIEWTDTTWNPVVGCTPVSPGCLNCYAATMARRLEAMGRPEYAARQVPGDSRKLMEIQRAEGVGFAEADRMRKPRTIRIAEKRAGRAVFTGDVRVVEDRLTDPLHWRKPRLVFVNSMSDLFHEDVPFAFIDRVFAVMALCPQHQFQVLTKRPERMAEYFGDVHARCLAIKYAITDDIRGGDETVRRAWFLGFPDWTGWPIPNVWLGTSVEDQARADERIPHLLRCPAAVLFLSCEPLLGPVKPQLIQWDPTYGDEVRSKIGWIIVGCESIGSRAGRFADGYEAAARSIIRQCLDAGVPVFHKQMPVNGRKSGNPAEWPEDLRVRQFPEVRQ